MDRILGTLLPLNRAPLQWRQPSPDDATRSGGLRLPIGVQWAVLVVAQAEAQRVLGSCQLATQIRGVGRVGDDGSRQKLRADVSCGCAANDSEEPMLLRVVLESEPARLALYEEEEVADRVGPPCRRIGRPGYQVLDLILLERRG